MSMFYIIYWFNKDIFRKTSKRNYIKRVYEIPNRGIISDRNGKSLAMNKLGFSINIKPHLRSYKNKHILEELVNTIVTYFPDFEKDKLIKK